MNISWTVKDKFGKVEELCKKINYNNFIFDDYSERVLIRDHSNENKKKAAKKFETKESKMINKLNSEFIFHDTAERGKEYSYESRYF